jgi:hypothetical protein
MINKLIALIVVGVFFVVGCNENPVEEKFEGNTFTSINVKEGLTDYFDFSSNTADTTGESGWDIAFTAISWSPAPEAPTIWDPYIIGNENITVARVNAMELSEVTDIPEEGFTANFNTQADAWYETDGSFIVVPLDYVYVVNTDDGKYPAFEIVNYYDNEGNSGVFTIHWKYLSE